MRTEHELAQVVSLFKSDYTAVHSPTYRTLKVLRHIEACRTAALGGHVDVCDECGTVHISYNSCRDRHCPKCQGMDREAWVEARKEDILPVKYFHVVFTLPEALHQIALRHRKEAYDALFRASWETISSFSGNLDIAPAMIAILHTWGSALTYHPHLHCIVPGGGIGASGKWKRHPHAASRRTVYLFPVMAMCKVFRAKYMAHLNRTLEIPPAVRKALFAKNWVVYCKPPVCGTDKVVEYLGRYVNRIAISNRRIKSVDADGVSFEYKNYRNDGAVEVMHLSGVEFLRRYCMHILPSGYVRIRHYGYLATASKGRLHSIQRQLNRPLSPRRRPKKTVAQICADKGLDYNLCPQCGAGHLHFVKAISYRPRAPGGSYAALRELLSAAI